MAEIPSAGRGMRLSPASFPSTALPGACFSAVFEEKGAACWN